MTSNYPGVCIQIMRSKCKIYKYFKSQTSLNGKKVNIGVFKTEIEAYNAYVDFIKKNERKIGNNKRYKYNKAA